MDLDDLKSRSASMILSELNDLIRILRKRNLKVSSWFGKFDLRGEHNTPERINRGYNYRALAGAVDDMNFPWFLYWEIVWVTSKAGLHQGQKVLDLGGSSSLFSYYLASKGFDVTTVDIQEQLVDNANFVAEQMGWNLRNCLMDVRQLKLSTKYDHVTSICVYHHIPVNDRPTVSRTIGGLLVDEGRFSVTFDFRNPSRARRISSQSDLEEQLINPSGLKIRGNTEFLDNGKNYLLHPFYNKRRLWKYKILCIAEGLFSPWEMFETKQNNDYTFGALFLEKR